MRSAPGIFTVRLVANRAAMPPPEVITSAPEPSVMSTPAVAVPRVSLTWVAATVICFVPGVPGWAFAGGGTVCCSKAKTPEIDWPATLIETGFVVVPATMRTVPASMPLSAMPVVFSFSAASIDCGVCPLRLSATVAARSATTPPLPILKVPRWMVSVTGNVAGLPLAVPRLTTTSCGVLSSSVVVESSAGRSAAGTPPVAVSVGRTLPLPRVIMIIRVTAL